MAHFTNEQVSKMWSSGQPKPFSASKRYTLNISQITSSYYSPSTDPQCTFQGEVCIVSSPVRLITSLL